MDIPPSATPFAPTEPDQHVGTHAHDAPQDPQSISLPLPQLSHITLHIQLTRYSTSNMIFLTTSDTADSSPSISPLGSFVYSMPNVKSPSQLSFLPSSQRSSSPSIHLRSSRLIFLSRQRLQPSDPLCTSLCAVTGTIDFATRAAKIVARKTGKPTYLGCSIGLGFPTVEEEMGALKTAVDAIVGMVET